VSGPYELLTLLIKDRLGEAIRMWADARVKAAMRSDAHREVINNWIGGKVRKKRLFYEVCDHYSASGMPGGELAGVGEWQREPEGAS
jgi:hypothetical protein